jgi:hypothetical protein
MPISKAVMRLITSSTIMRAPLRKHRGHAKGSYALTPALPASLGAGRAVLERAGPAPKRNDRPRPTIFSKVQCVYSAEDFCRPIARLLVSERTNTRQRAADAEPLSFRRLRQISKLNLRSSTVCKMRVVSLRQKRLGKKDFASTGLITVLKTRGAIQDTRKNCESAINSGNVKSNSANVKSNTPELFAKPRGSGDS